MISRCILTVLVDDGRKHVQRDGSGHYNVNLSMETPEQLLWSINFEKVYYRSFSVRI